MTTVDELSVSPASDCNSNNVDVSYNSTVSDTEFIQDNSDYQWFTDYGYSREVQQQHQSVLSSGYDELARDLDSQLALVDMEDYSAQEILSTLPAMCCTDIQSERQGEMFASVSGSLMVKYDFDSSISPHSSTQEEESVSMSEPLFSPVKETPPLPCTNYSVDSLDCDCEDLVLTCQATNKHNYTIAFHGSTTMADTSSQQDESVCSSSDGDKKFESSESGVEKGMTISESSPTTTWSKVRRLPPASRQPRHRSKTISLPDLAPQNNSQLSNSFAHIERCVKLYDVQNSGSLTTESYSGDIKGSAASFTRHENFSLLRLFIAQRNHTETHNQLNDNDNRLEGVRNNNVEGMNEWAGSECAYEDSLVRGGASSSDASSSVERLSSCKSDSVCTCSMSTSSNNKFNVNNNNSFEQEPVKKHNVKVGTSTSDLSSATTTSSGANNTVRPVLPRCPVHCMDRSMQTSQTTHQIKKQEDGGGSPVYVLYPNYTLPDLGFLRHNRLDLEKVLLAPVRYSPTTPQQPAPAAPRHHRTALTRHDLNLLKQKGVGHVMDWSSLTPLLPSECWSILAEIPQVKQHSNARFENTKPQFCLTPSKDISSPFPSDGRTKTSSESGCSDGTSGYRGSSTLLNESSEAKQSNPLFVYNYSSTQEGQVKPRAKSDSAPQDNKEKRFSMFEFPDSILDDVFEKDSVCLKRKSLPVQCPSQKVEREGWEGWEEESRERSLSPPARHALRLDQLLGSHEATSSLDVDWHPHDVINLRHQVSRFLSENSRKNVSFANKEHQKTPPNSPANQKHYQVKATTLNEFFLGQEDVRLREPADKKGFVDGVISGVEKVLRCHGNSSNGAECNEVADAALSALCPSLYALMSDGLKPNLDTPFGPIGNSVWQVVEASAHQGLVTKALNDLVMKLNNEDVLSEGLIKFNAFIFGLLNVGGLEAWISYLRTRESVLSKHYCSDALLLRASQGHAVCRKLTDRLITGLKPLSQLHLSLDLLYETRLLHTSLLQLNRIPVSPTGCGVDLSSDSMLVRKIVQSLRNCGISSGSCTSCESNDLGESGRALGRRPRSCVENVGGVGSDCAGAGRKRWSGVPIGSRLASAFDSLGEEVDPSGASPISSPEDPANPPQTGKFRSLQRKWELLSNKTSLRSPDLSPVKSSVSSSSSTKSRIPRPVTSPVRPSARLPGSTTSRIPMAPARGRASRLDGAGSERAAGRPASLPHSRGPSSSAVSSAALGAARRAASSSNTRPPHKQSKPPVSSSNRYVVTLCHRLPSDSGHLAFNAGERLRLVLEVDDTWLLCCRDNSKGLVPRSAVI